MARQAHTPDAAAGSYPTAGVALTWTAADTTNKEEVVLTGRELLLAWNTSAAAAHTVTINSVANQQGRTGNITEDSIAFGAIHVYGPFTDRKGWMQSGGLLHFEGDHAEIKFCVIRLP